MVRILPGIALAVSSFIAAGQVMAGDGAAASVGVIDKRISIQFPPRKCITDGVVYKRGGRIRFRLRLVGSGKGEEWRVEVTSQYGKILVTAQNRAEFGETFLSPQLDGQRSTICVSSDAPYLEAIAVIKGELGSRVLSVVGPDNEGPNFDPISDYESGRKRMEVGGDDRTDELLTLTRGVAWLGIEQDRQHLGCTGWFATPTLMITNSHCAEPNASRAIVRVWVRRGRDVDFGAKDRFDAPTFQTADVVFSGAERKLDYALLRTPSAVPESHVLQIHAIGRPGPMHLILPQFPHSGPLVVNSDTDCTTVGASRTRPRLEHGCDSDRGSSGSPVIDRELRHGVVALHFWGHDGDQSKGNRAIPMRSIVADLEANAATLWAEIDESQRKLRP